MKKDNQAQRQTKPSQHIIKTGNAASHTDEVPCATGPTSADIDRAVETLRRGGLILYPTDTVWGIGCDATNAEAVRQIYNLKRRADSKAMIVLVGSTEMLEQYVEDVPEVAFQLIEASVRPTTIVYDRGVGLARELLAPDGSVGVRVTSEHFSQMLCRKLRRPIVSTSANTSGSPTARFFEEISDDIKTGVDYVAEYRRNDHRSSRPSCVIKLSSSGVVTVLRK